MFLYNECLSTCLNEWFSSFNSIMLLYKEGGWQNGFLHLCSSLYSWSDVLLFQQLFVCWKGLFIASMILEDLKMHWLWSKMHITTSMGLTLARLFLSPQTAPIMEGWKSGSKPVWWQGFLPFSPLWSQSRSLPTQQLQVAGGSSLKHQWKFLKQIWGRIGLNMD